MGRAAWAFWPDRRPSPLATALTVCLERALLAPVGGPLYAIVEDDDSIGFDRAALAERSGSWVLRADQEGKPLTDWAQGRVFGALGELRWREREGWLLAVLLTDADGDLPDGFGDVLPLPVGEPTSHLLWGEWAQGAWRDGQVPDDLEYPLPARPGYRAWIEVQSYRDERGVAAFSRYAGLAARPGASPPRAKKGGE